MNATIVMPDGDPTCDALFASAPRAEALAGLGGLRLYTDAPLASAETYLERCRSARALIVGWPLPDEVLALPGIEAVTFMGAGVANFVSLDQAREHGVAVYNTPGYGDIAVAEHTVALMLAALRDIPAANAAMHRGTWPQSAPSQEIHGATVGVVGLGGIGARVARMLDAWGARVIAWTRNPDRARDLPSSIDLVELPELFAHSDIVSLHVALCPATEGLVSAELIRAMPTGALLVNTARAELVDEVTLQESLRAGRIRAALDVFRPEPLPTDHPYRELPGVVLSPHIAFNTPQALERMADLTIANLKGHFEAGTGPHRVA